ncbi:MAG: CDP-glycerol glycerophosphotransferase family protein [Eggerthellaceae bacterium]|nr:CDP-glycerol glycerophosphotransferase family protein [Eggerthellaceae bacterium]
MKTFLVHIAKGLFNILYKLFCATTKRRDEILFFSRQTNEPSYDFCSLARDFEALGWHPVILVKKLAKSSVIPYSGMVFKEIYHLARCRICVVDRYDPVICMLNFRNDEPTFKGSVPVHTDYPAEPVVVQMWHAFGAFKKFGYQSLDTPEGHRSQTLERFDIHRNYSWVVCSGEACRAAFAEAFGYPKERVIALHRPEYHKLQGLRRSGGAELVFNDPPIALFAPTLRKSKASPHPFRDAFVHGDELQGRLKAKIAWSFHPLDQGLSAPGDVSEALLTCDFVVTDYSSIVYEAYLLGKPVIFYVPDIKRYRKSPGLNADPLRVAPELCARTEDELVSKVNKVACTPESYRWDALERFVAQAFDGGCDDCVETLRALADRS